MPTAWRSVWAASSAPLHVRWAALWSRRPRIRPSIASLPAADLQRAGAGRQHAGPGRPVPDAERAVPVRRPGDRLCRGRDGAFCLHHRPDESGVRRHPRPGPRQRVDVRHRLRSDLRGPARGAAREPGVDGPVGSVHARGDQRGGQCSECGDGALHDVPLPGRGDLGPAADCGGRRRLPGHAEDSLVPVPAYTFLLLSGALFTMGAIGFLVRRNPLVVFMCIELMLNAVNLAFAAISRYLNSLDGVVFAFLVITVAAAEVVVGIAIIVQVYRAGRQMDVDGLDLMKE